MAQWGGTHLKPSDVASHPSPAGWSQTPSEHLGIPRRAVRRTRRAAAGRVCYELVEMELVEIKQVAQTLACRTSAAPGHGPGAGSHTCKPGHLLPAATTDRAIRTQLPHCLI